MSVKFVVLLAVGIILIGVLVVPFSIQQTDDNTLDVIIVDGQSNAQYWGWANNWMCNPSVVNESGLEAPSHNLYYYGDSTPTYYGVTYAEATYDTTLQSYDLHPMYDNGAWVIGGYGPVLGKTLSDRSGHDVLIIDVGVGAASISWLTSTGPGGVYADRIISDALSKVPSGYRIDILGMVWAQGEADKNTSVSTYIENFNKLYADFNNRFGLEKVYIIKTRDAVGGNSIEAQNQLAEDNPNIVIATDITDTFTTDNGYLRPDELHYSQQGRSLIAGILGDQISYTEHAENEYLDLLNVLPVLLIVVLVATAAGAIFIKRD